MKFSSSTISETGPARELRNRERKYSEMKCSEMKCSETIAAAHSETG